MEGATPERSLRGVRPRSGERIAAAAGRCSAREDRRADIGERFFRGSAHQGGLAERKALIDRDTKQAELLEISRGSVYYLPRPVSEADLKLIRRLDELHLELPFAGSRMLRALQAADGRTRCSDKRSHLSYLIRHEWLDQYMFATIKEAETPV